MDRDPATTAFLGGLRWQLDYGPDPAAGVGDHWPSQPRDLTGAEPGFDAQQHDHSIAVRVASSSGCPEHPTNLTAAKHLGGLSKHRTVLRFPEKSRATSLRFRVTADCWG